MIQKVFVTANNTAVFECPKCNKTKMVNVSKYKMIEKAVRIKVNCPCGNSYPVFLERRKHYRKSANFPGKFVLYQADNKIDTGMMRVIDVSRSGLKLKMNVKREFSIGDRLMVEFTLDDQKRSTVKKEVVVRKVADDIVGVEFVSVSASDPSDSALGFYLMN